MAALSTAQNRLLWGEIAGFTHPVRVWITNQDQKFKEVKPLHWKASDASAIGTIQIDPTERYQSLLGFGAAFTDASCYLFSRMDSQARKALLGELFGKDGLRFSVGRTCIGSSDYSTQAYSYDDSVQPDPQLTHFSIEHDRAYILPSLREARALHPDLFLFSSPWSPPGWMKAGDSLLGGSMRKHYFAAYAEYFVRFLKGYAADGVKINAVTVQNEVDTDQDGRMPAALWGQEYEMDFVKSFLGPAFEHASLDTKIWILDHNYDLWGRAMDELSDPAVYKYVDGVAWHGYVGAPDAMTRVHNAFPQKNMYWTEGGPDYTHPDYATDWSKWSETFTGVLRNWARCIVGWNLALDENGKPNIGPFSCGGLVTINSKTQKITRSGQYWAFAHYSKAVQRNARVIASKGELPDIQHVAFVNPDNTQTLVLTNRGKAQNVECRLGSHVVAVSLPEDSIATLVW
ncbi:MAG: glycoside hydrolase family 30 protein [Acidobacteriaceae bacterium]